MDALMDWKAGQRYFYFQSLLTKPHNSELYQIGKAGQKAIHDGSSSLIGNLTNEKNDDESLIKQTLQFLSIMQQAELAQEKAYFQNKVNELKKAGVTDKITKFFEDSSNFNYQDFIIAINVLYQDINSFKKTIQVEDERLSSIKVILDEFDDWVKKSPNNYDYTKTRNQNIRDWLFSTMKLNLPPNEPLTRGKLYEYLGSKTIGNELQSRLSSIFSTVWKNHITKEKIEQLIAEGKLANTDIAKKTLVMELVTDYITKASAEIKTGLVTIEEDIKDGVIQADKKKVKDTLKNRNTQKAQEIVDTFFSDTPDADGYAKKTLTYFLSQINTLTDDSTANDVTRAQERIFNKMYKISYNEDTNNIKNLSQELSALLNKILDKKGITTSKTKKNSTERTKLIQRVKDYLATVQTSDPNVTIKIDNAAVTKYLQQLINEADLIEIHIAAKDNLLSEMYLANDTRRLAQRLGDLLISTLTTDGQKIDTAALEICNIEALPQYEQFNSLLTNSLSDIIIQTTQISRKPIEIIDSNNQLLEFDELSWRKSHGFDEGEFSIEAETLRRKYIKTNIIQKTRQKLAQLTNDTNVIEEIIKQIENSIQIGATVKSYNKYDNNIGFHGGSLGGNADMQLKNIIKMLDYGGITPDDADWLYLATYNAGPELLGSDLKNPLEAIFSAMGAMLLFDDAGEQAEYIKTILASGQQIEKTSPQFIHLYHLNNLYVPSSYVLQKTYEAMIAVTNDLTSEMGNKGVKATITNNVTYDGVSTDMGAFFSAHKDEVSITLTFLAGFLDIVQEINTALGAT